MEEAKTPLAGMANPYPQKTKKLCPKCRISYPPNRYGSCPLCEERKVSSSLREELAIGVQAEDNLRDHVKRLELEVADAQVIKDAFDLMPEDRVREWKGLAYMWRSYSGIMVLFDPVSRSVVIDGDDLIHATSPAEVVLIDTLERLCSSRGSHGAMQILLDLLADRLVVTDALR